jgi:Mg-chelatase subunit ChlD
MSDYHLTFAAPAYLALLALAPALWWLSYRRLAALGPWRRWVAMLLRGLLLACVAFAAAEIQIVRTSDRLTVVYLLDQSLSIPAPRRQAMIDYVNAEVHRRRLGRDRAGVVVFGRDAAVEIPPFDAAVRIEKTIECTVDPEYTHLAAAMKLAQAVFPEDAAKRIVVLSDGNQNMGNVVEQAQALSVAGVGIDVLAVLYRPRAEVSVDRVVVPPDVRRDEPFDLRVVMTNTAEQTAGRSGDVPGRLVISRTAGGQTEVVGDEAVLLPPGKKVFTVRQKIDAANFYVYEARFVPDRPGNDLPQNNRASAFTHLRGKSRVLLIEDHERPGEFATLADRLRRQGIEVEQQPSSCLFAGLADLQPFDAVVLANVPRERFSDAQIDMLARNTQQLGAGLVMLGGPGSFGAGGWTDTEIEKAMPVDFQIKSMKVVPQGALMLVIDNSGSMMGEKLEMCKAAAVASVQTLGPQDYVGVVVFNGGAEWIVRMTRASASDAIIRRIKQIGSAGGTFMQPGMTYGRDGLMGTNASVKHMIVLSDGQTQGSGYENLAAEIRKAGITITTVAIEPGANNELLQRVAQFGGGKFYHVKNPRSLPRIFMQETRRVARPVIWDKHPVRPLVKMPGHEILGGIDGPLPPITGFVMTSRKEGSPLIETLITSPEPAGEENNTVLAGWAYGAGKAVAFTSDAGARWTAAWTPEPLYEKLFGQMIRWSMRPAGDTGKYTVATEVADGQVRVVVNALDKKDEFLNFLNIGATAIGPDMKPIPLRIEQTSPGRYLGSFPARDAGSYFLMLSPGLGQAPIRAGVTVPYSDEFRDREPNEALLRQLAATEPKGGPAGQIAELPDAVDKASPLAAFDPFRHDLAKATSHQDAWHYLLLAACCILFCDVLCRRVQIGFGWAPPLAARCRDWLLRRRPKLAAPEFIERLRSRKEEVSGHFEQLRSATRFEPPPQTAARLDVLQPPAAGGDAVESDRPAAPAAADAAKPPAESYTERLLKAKKKVWEEKK